MYECECVCACVRVCVGMWVGAGVGVCLKDLLRIIEVPHHLLVAYVARGRILLRIEGDELDPHVVRRPVYVRTCVQGLIVM